MQYGIIIGRFQPLHFGHQTIINEIINDGLQPIVLIGSSNKKDKVKNPLSYVQRVKMIHTVYPAIITLPLPDRVFNGVWASQIVEILSNIGIYFENCRLYYYGKEGDFDITPLVENWFKPYRPVSKMPDICASQIRHDPLAYTNFMDGRVHKQFISYLYG